MIAMQIDLSSVEREMTDQAFQLNELSDRVLDTLTTKFKEYWLEGAVTGTNRTRREFENGLSVEKLNDEYYRVSLDGVLANMIEEGSPAFDMKMGFGRSPKTKSTKDGGWYLTIPIQGSSRLQQVQQLAGRTAQQHQSRSSSEETRFLRVSNKSNPESWIHPGFQARDFGGKALNRLYSESDNLVNEIVEQWRNDISTRSN